MDLITTKRLCKVALFSIILCLLLVVGGAVLAQKSVGGSINLDVADIELAAVVRMLARDSGQNIIVVDHEKLHSKVSATLTNVTLDTALRQIVENAGCTWRRDADGTYVIGAQPKAQKDPASSDRVAPLVDPTGSYGPSNLAGESPRDIVWDSLKLHNTSPVDIMWLLGAYRTEQATEIDRAVVKPGVYLPNAMRMSPQNGTPPLIDPVMRVLGENEAGRIPSVSEEAAQGGPPPFGGRPTTGNPNQPNPNPNNPQGTNAQSLMPEGIDYLMPYPADNSLLVKGTPEGIEELHDLIKKLDIAPRQVSIKAEFVEISTNDTSSLGIDWSTSQMGQSFKTQFGPTGNVLFAYTNGNIMANLRTSLGQNKAKVVNAPIISTLNNTPASITVTKQVPYWTSVVTSPGQGNVVTAQQPQQLTIQSTLMVLPRINGDGSITVTIQPQVSDQAEMFTGPDGTQLPAVNQEFLTTTRRVMNGETIVVGGIIRKKENNSVNKIPLLGDLPIIGPLFRSVNKSTEDRELLIFLTPTIVPERSTAGTGVGVSL